MDIRPHLRALQDHFVIVWMLVITIGYILIRLFGTMDFPEYLTFIFAMVLAYYIISYRSIFWLFIWLCWFYLIFSYLVPDATVAKMRESIRKNFNEIVQKAEVDIREIQQAGKAKIQEELPKK